MSGNKDAMQLVAAVACSTMANDNKVAIIAIIMGEESVAENAPAAPKRGEPEQLKLQSVKTRRSSSPDSCAATALRLAESQIYVTSGDVCKSTGKSRAAGNTALATLAEEGTLKRIRRGVYSLA